MTMFKTIGEDINYELIEIYKDLNDFQNNEKNYVFFEEIADSDSEIELDLILKRRKESEKDFDKPLIKKRNLNFDLIKRDSLTNIPRTISNKKNAAFIYFNKRIDSQKIEKKKSIFSRASQKSFTEINDKLKIKITKDSTLAFDELYNYNLENVLKYF